MSAAGMLGGQNAQLPERWVPLPPAAVRWHESFRRAAKLAAQVGIEVIAISKYSLEPLSRGGLLFGYAGTDEEAILHGVKKLAAVLEQL